MRAALLVLGALTIGAAGVGIAVTAPDAQRSSAKAAAMRVRPHPPRRPLRPDRRPVPVLMYHEVARYTGGPIDRSLYVRPGTFMRQLAWLAQHRFKGVTLARVEAAWAGHARLPARPIVITFDDGYRSVYQHAFRWLRHHGWPAVLNLAVGNLQFAGGLTQAQVERLIRAGWELASHTIHHVQLRGVGHQMQHDEIAGSRAFLRSMFHVPVRNFAYPEGKWDRNAIAVLRRAGYAAAAGIAPGLMRPSERFHFDRIRVDDSDGVAGLRRKLAAQGVP